MSSIKASIPRKTYKIRPQITLFRADIYFITQYCLAHCEDHLFIAFDTATHFHDFMVKYVAQFRLLSWWMGRASDRLILRFAFFHFSGSSEVTARGAVWEMTKRFSDKLADETLLPVFFLSSHRICMRSFSLRWPLGSCASYYSTMPVDRKLMSQNVVRGKSISRRISQSPVNWR